MKFSQLSINIIFNFVGSIGVSIIQFVTIPIYVRHLGVEAYGLVGFYTTLYYSFFAIIDFGLGTTINREIARMSASDLLKSEVSTFIKTVQVLYGILTLIVLLSFLILSPFIALHSFGETSISANDLSTSIFQIGVLIALRLPISLYSGAMFGLQRQDQFNIINVSIELLRVFAILLGFYIWNNSLFVFFNCQILISFILIIVLFFYTWKNLPKAMVNKIFDSALLAPLWKYASGVSVLSLAGGLVTQVDKLVLIRCLPLKEYSLYVLVSFLSIALGKISNPIYQAVYPKFVQLLNLGKELELRDVYLKASSLMSLLLIPIAMNLIFFSEETIFLWQRNIEIAHTGGKILLFLAIGNMFNGLYHVPFALQLAFGKIRLPLVANLSMLAFTFLCTSFFVKEFGVVGAAYVWVLMNFTLFLVSPFFMHRFVLLQLYWKWLIKLNIVPLLLSIVVYSLGYFVMHTISSPEKIVIIGIMLFCMATSAASIYVNNRFCVDSGTIKL